MDQPLRYAGTRWAEGMGWNHQSLHRWLGNRPSRSLGPTRRVQRAGDDIQLVLHQTPVVTYHPDNTYTLRTGGWHTNVTNDTIRAVTPIRTYLRGGRRRRQQWNEPPDGQIYLPDGRPLEDGVRLNSDGSPVAGEGPTMGDLMAWHDSLAEDPTRALIFADWLEERNMHADPFTLEQLRHPEAASHRITLGDRGKVVARVTNYRPRQPPERMTRKLTKREKIARLRGRLIKREVAKGVHPDRKTAVLSALALSINAGEV